MANLVLGAVGAVIGWFAGGPAGAFQGFMIGYSVGNAVDPPKGPDSTAIGPRLSDSRVQSSTFGLDIPMAFNSTRLAGNIIWQMPVKETQHSDTTGGGGKGGAPSQGATTTITYTYSIDMAIAICQGPGVQLKKIWANGSLIYDVTNDTGSVAFSWHDGSETQTPDSYMQSFVGVNDTCAFRGTAYIVFHDHQLAHYGNTTPNFEFEVYVPFATLGDIVAYLCTMYLR